MVWAPVGGCGKRKERDDDPPLVVLTGGSGIVGRALARQLVQDLPDHRLLVLTRRPAHLQLSGSAAVFADICRPDLGLAPEIRNLVADRAELFVHGAADIRFNLSLDQSRRTNTEGTRNILGVARQCRRLRHFAHISTLYVAGRRQGWVHEEPLRHTAGYVNSYESSKHEAEDLILRDSSNLPVGIYRLSSVTDLSGSDGHVRKLLRLAVWAEGIRCFPGDARVAVDLISSEWAARAMSALLTKHAEPGCVRHLCAGEAGSVQLGSVVDRVLAACESGTGRPRPNVRLLPFDEFVRLRGFMNANRTQARVLASLTAFIPHLSLHQPFDNRTTSQLLRRSGVEEASVDSILTALLSQEFRRPAHLLPSD
jgi:nucleoside-diphosphate-sugar epimerase